MKKVFFSALILIFMCSCYPKMIRSSFVLDYRPFSKEGFFVTESNSVSFKYQPIGSVSSELISGATPYYANSKSPKSENVPKSTMSDVDKLTYATPDGALKELYNTCVLLGANGVVSLKITKYFVKGRTAWSASGMAIKMEN